MKQVQQAAEAVLQQLETVIFGKRAVLELVLACLLAEGHLLLEDVPGTAKTLLAKALARTRGGGFRRSTAVFSAASVRRMSIERLMA